jgi:hypothetical protein
LNGVRIAHEPAALLFKAAAIEIPYANCRPAQLGHNLCKVPVRPRRTIALLNLQEVHQACAGDTLQPIEARLAAL